MVHVVLLYCSYDWDGERMHVRHTVVILTVTLYCRRWLSASSRQWVGSQGHLWSRPVGSAAALRSKFSHRCALKQKNLMTQTWMVTIMVILDTSDKYMNARPHSAIPSHWLRKLTPEEQYSSLSDQVEFTNHYCCHGNPSLVFHEWTQFVYFLSKCDLRIETCPHIHGNPVAQVPPGSSIDKC